MVTALFAERRVPVGWAVAGALALVVTYGVAEEQRLVVLATGALIALVTVAALALREPRWAVVGLVFAAYTTLFDAARAATGLPVSRSLAIVAVIALLVWHGGRRPPLRLPAGRDLALAVALLATIAISALSAVDSAVTLSALVPVATAAVIALLISTLAEPTWLARAMWAAASGGAALAALSLFQQVTGTYDNTYLGLAIVKLDAGIARAGGPFEPNFFAQTLVISAGLAAYLALRAVRPAERSAGLVLATLCVAGVAATASRGGTLALGVMLVLLLALRRPRVRVLVPMAAVAIAVGAFLLPAETTKRITSVAEATDVERSLVQDTSFRGRFVENVTAVYMFRDNPLIGVGTGNYPVRYAEYSTFAGREWRPVRQPHNLYLESFAETGVIGGTTLLVFLWLTATGAWRARRYVDPRSALLAEGCFVALAGVLTTSIFLHAAFLSVMWTAFGLAWAAAAMGRAAKRQSTATA